MPTLDHLIYGAGDLDAGIEALEAATGVRAAPGGSHPGRGTRNALCSLGEAYLEVMAPDPAQPGGPLADRFTRVDRPRLVSWVARTPDLDRTAALATAAGWDTEIASMSRATPDGTVLSWRLLFVHGHPGGRLVPFLIDWGTTPHPSASAPAGLELDWFRLESPAPGRLVEVLAALQIEAAVREGSDEALAARLRTPAGPVTLRGSAL